MRGIDGRQCDEDRVLRHVEEPYHRGTLENATHRQRVDNTVCGDSVQLDLSIDNAGVITEAWFTAQGCIISQAAASMLVEHLKGMVMSDALAFTAEDMLALFGARLLPRRQRCCLLAWEAMRRALKTPVSDL